ncbi:hypothetical protein GF420_04695 [candidate division GN15 bacterium]|nr:hypothetical protein [candidate division GN15 bacterium]
MSAFLFLLVVYGTFLTRSGVLADFSVHSFVDLGVNVYLIAFMVVFLVLSVAIFAWRAARVPSAPLNYNPYGREFSLFAAMFLLFVTGVIVLFWSSLPVITSALGMEPRAAEVATYNDFALPLAILFSLMLMYSPFSTYADATTKPNGLWIGVGFAVAAAFGFGFFYALMDTGFTYAILFTVVLGGVIMYLLRPGGPNKLIPALVGLGAASFISAIAGVSDLLYLLFIATATMGVVSNVIVLAPQVLRNWPVTGGHISHAGFTIMLIGILASSAYSTNEKLIIPRDDMRQAFGVMVGYQGMEDDIMQVNNELKLSMVDDGETVQLNPELYYSQRMDGLFKKPAIFRTLLQDLYMAPEQILEAEASGGVTLRRDEPRTIGDVTFTFLGFSVSEHATGVDQAGLRATALVTATTNGVIDTVAPAVIQRVADDGHTHLVDDPGMLRTPTGDTLLVTIEGLQVDRGEITLGIPGLTSAGVPERLVLDVSRKPLINLVWAGAILIILGTGIVFYRRWRESIDSSAGTSRA